MASRNWTREEVEATVSDYFAMLENSVAGKDYSKAEHRRGLQKMLNGRTEKAIDYKHMNISAVLYKLGFPRILPGYPPMYNFQAMLFKVVEKRLSGSHRLVHSIEIEEEKPIVTPYVEDILSILTPPPKSKPSDSKVREPAPTYAARQVNYLERESRNQKLGLAGEELIYRYEQERLTRLGHEQLAAKVDHVSKTRGDGMGFDILSYEVTGQERLIEVKTTKYGKGAPFFVSRNEVDKSGLQPRQYYLYRLFAFQENIGLFILNGALPKICSLEPEIFKASAA